MPNATKLNPTSTKARRLAAAMDAARQRLGLETLADRHSDALDFHDLAVGPIRDAIEHAFEAGYAAALGGPAPFKFDPANPGEMLETLEFTRDKRSDGGTWVKGSVGGHAFEALVFPEHAKSADYEMGDSRISKFWLKDGATDAEVASFDRGWDLRPTTDAARAIVDLLSAGLAEHIFMK